MSLWVYGLKWIKFCPFIRFIKYFGKELNSHIWVLPFICFHHRHIGWKHMDIYVVFCFISRRERWIYKMLACYLKRTALFVLWFERLSPLFVILLQNPLMAEFTFIHSKWSLRYLNGLFTQKLSWLIHPQVVPNLYEFLSSVEHKGLFFFLMNVGTQTADKIRTITRCAYKLMITL